MPEALFYRQAEEIGVKMFVTITSSKGTTEQAAEAEEFLRGFLPRLKQQRGVVAILHYRRPEKQDESTTIVWESQEALQAYRNGELINEAIAFESKMNMPATREGYPLTLGYGLQTDV